jgi:hypothetical protein
MPRTAAAAASSPLSMKVTERASVREPCEDPAAGFGPGLPHPGLE